MSTKSEPGFKNPPLLCPACGSERMGIQGGRMYFKCGTYFVKEERRAYQTDKCRKLKQIVKEIKNVQVSLSNGPIPVPGSFGLSKLPNTKNPPYLRNRGNDSSGG